jgi:hypothetical protein
MPAADSHNKRTVCLPFTPCAVVRPAQSMLASMHDLNASLMHGVVERSGCWGCDHGSLLATQHLRLPLKRFCLGRQNARHVARAGNDIGPQGGTVPDIAVVALVVDASIRVYSGKGTGTGTDARTSVGQSVSTCTCWTRVFANFRFAHVRCERFPARKTDHDGTLLATASSQPGLRKHKSISSTHSNAVTDQSCTAMLSQIHAVTHPR